VIVVADTSPLNYLIQMELADLLGDVYGAVVIPDAVARELADARAPSAVRLWMVELPAWIQCVAVKRFDDTLPDDLGRGESEAISLAMELNATVLLDDKRGRIEAAARHVETAGTLAVLLQGALKGKVDLRVSIDRLKALGFRIAQEIEDGIFERYRRLSNRT
jgi:predicted nucleic acid-binding protein